MSHCTILNDPLPSSEQLHVISNPISAYKYMKVHYIHRIPVTRFGHSRGHIQGGALKRIGILEYHINF